MISKSDELKIHPWLMFFLKKFLAEHILSCTITL